MSEALNKLAMNGGERAIKHPLPARRHFGAEERAAALRVIDAAIEAGGAPGYGGNEEILFCEEFAAMLGGGYCDAVNSGSTAVFVGLRALEIEPFSEIIIGPVNDPGGMMPIVMMNCIPVVADSDKDSFNISLESIKERVTPLTSAIVVPHIAGEPADIENICNFAKSKGLKVVEDCAQAHGAYLNGKPVGTFGDTGAFSLMFGKHTCVGGQGGMIFTKSEDIYWKVRQNSDRGKPFGLPPGSENCVGTLNFNMDDLHCAIGREQIKKTKIIADGRRRVVGGIMERIREYLADIPALRMTKLPEGAEASYWFMRLLLDTSYVTCDKSTFVTALAAEGVPCGGRYGATPYTGSWYTDRHVFGTSGYPWASPDYKGDKDKIYTLADVPNAAKAIDETFIVNMYESWQDINIVEFALAVKKIYEAYKK